MPSKYHNGQSSYATSLKHGVTDDRLNEQAKQESLGTKRRFRPLFKRELLYVEALAAGKSRREALIAAGYKATNLGYAANSMAKNEAVQAALEEIQSKARTSVAYTVTVAMEEAQEVIEFAKQHRNAMAYFKAVEHRAKLSGLLVDRIAVETVDLTGALAEAAKRAVTARVINQPSLTILPVLPPVATQEEA
jgi:hypothetical protein